MFKYRGAGVLLLLLCPTFCATAQMARQPATARIEVTTGTITGRVTNENGLPHVYSDVIVRPVAREGVPVTRTSTNREGAFKLSGLPHGTYIVSAAVPAHIPKSPEAGPVVFKPGDVVTLVLIEGGVVTGTVTDTKGDPVIDIGVRVRMVSDESGRKYGDGGKAYENFTDDRGVYRVYGVPTGTYVVSADGSVEERSFPTGVRGFGQDLPTYAPSSNRESATEISVRTGEEVSDVNIRYRGERGSTISGIVNGLNDDNRGISAALTSMADHRTRWSKQSTSREFTFDGIPDGEYELSATAYWSDLTRRQSESIFLTVKSADIEGLELTASLLASIKGRVVVERLKTSPPECSEKRQPQFSEMSVSAWRRVSENSRKKPQFVSRAGGTVTPDAQGAFSIPDVASSEYYFAVRYSLQQWYLRSITLPPLTPNGKPVDVTRAWTIVKPGEQLSGLTFAFAQGAGLVRGEVARAEGQTLPEKSVAFLVPAEPERVDEVLSYFAAPVSSAGQFWLQNVASGRYWLVVQPSTDDTRNEVSKIRLPDGTELRSRLRRLAGSTKTEIELKPCQEITVRL